MDEIKAKCATMVMGRYTKAVEKCGHLSNDFYLALFTLFKIDCNFENIEELCNALLQHSMNVERSAEIFAAWYMDRIVLPGFEATFSNGTNGEDNEADSFRVYVASLDVEGKNGTTVVTSGDGTSLYVFAGPESKEVDINAQFPESASQQELREAVTRTVDDVMSDPNNRIINLTDDEVHDENDRKVRAKMEEVLRVAESNGMMLPRKDEKWPGK